MDLTEMIANAQGGRGLEMLGRQFNLDEAQTRAAIDQLAPAVMAGVRRETQSADGISGLIKALATGDHARYLDGDESGIVDDGNAILGHVFGSKDVSRGVAAHAAAASGIPDGTLKQMLPMIAALVMGALGKSFAGGGTAAGAQAAAPSALGGGGLGDILGQVLGGGMGGGGRPASGGGGGLGDILGQILGGGGSMGGRPMPGNAGAAPGGGGDIGDVLGQIFGGGVGGSGGGDRPMSGNMGGTNPQAGGGIGDILGQIFGSNAPPQVREEATRRAGDAMGEILGRNTSSGNAADDLLASVDRALGRR